MRIDVTTIGRLASHPMRAVGILPVAVAVTVLVGLLATGAAAAPADQPRYPILLVHGITWHDESTYPVWGDLTEDDDGRPQWTGMIGYLESRGLAFGGDIRAETVQIELPESLETDGVRGDPRKARVFNLWFSDRANADGLAYKALELTAAIKAVCQFTGSPKVRIIAHSAGGLVVRAYLQSALPGLKFDHDVDRLITIGTPHLGSSLAEHWGDYFGTRTTSVKPSATLIVELNNKFDLPADVTFASIVVRGIAADQRGDADGVFDELIDHELVEALPVEYRIGGDQVVHARSQNLRLARCARRYEETTDRPVQYLSARVYDPTPEDDSPRELKVHMVAPAAAPVQTLVANLLEQEAFFQKRRLYENRTWCDWLARVHAFGAVERATLNKHICSELRSVEFDTLELADQGEAMRRYDFAAKAWSVNRLIGFRKRWTEVSGSIELKFDRFGRVASAEVEIDECHDQ
ncbi:MAG: hypothetical protein HQ581_09460 [Planctomycetes bacterium]|nr:hypothetical protein [Planctomycetota bacterium]